MTNPTDPKSSPCTTLSEFAGWQAGAFGAYLEDKQTFLEKLDKDAEARAAQQVLAALEKKMAWVA